MIPLRLERVSKSFTSPDGEAIRLFTDVSLEVNAGEVVAIMGRSGSGKSTMLRGLGLFQPFDEGSYHLLGTDVTTLSDARCSDLRSRDIGFIFQDFRLLPRLTALRNVEYAGILAGMPRRARKRAALDALETVGLSQRAAAYPQTLSGGEQQRVAIARALVKNPHVILADEPTGALDEATAGDVLHTLTTVARASGAAVLLVTHDRAVAGMCDRIVALTGAALVEQPAGSPA